MLHAFQAASPAVEGSDQIRKGLARPRLQLVCLDDLARGLEQWNAAGAGKRMDFLHRRVAEPALGYVDDALELEIVSRIERDVQVGDGVLDLLALIEAGATDDFGKATPA